MEITRADAKTLEIQNIYEIPLDVLVTNQALSQGNLMWIDGLLICFAGYHATDKTIHEQIDGIYKWVHLEYTFDLPEYKPTLKPKELHIEVPVFNMSHNPFYQDVAKYIKTLQDK